MRDYARHEMIGGVMKQQAKTVTATLVRTDGNAVDLSAADPAALPRRMRVLKFGENPNARGKRVFVGDKLLRALSSPVYPFRKVPLDYEHNTLKGTPAYAETKEPREVAGFGLIECVPGDGVYLCMETWTPSGLKSARNFCDLSGAAVTDKTGEVIAIPSVALCRCGAVEGMDFAEVPLSVPLSAWSVITSTQEDSRMNWKDILIKALGLAEDVSDADLQAALTDALKKPDAAALNAEMEKVVTPLNAKLTAFEVELQKVRAAAAKRERQDLIAQARSQGKVVALSAAALDKLSIEDLQEHIKQIPVTVPLSARTPLDVDDGAAAHTISDDQRTVALNCGVEPEKVWPKRAAGALLACLTAGLMLIGMAAPAFAAPRDTPARTGELISLTAGGTIEQGALAGVWTNGLGYAAFDDAAFLVIGRAENYAVAGDAVTVRRGVFRYDNGGAFTDAHIGQWCYVLDWKTVSTAAIATNDAVAGVIVDVDTSGVWVDCSALYRATAASLASLSVVGNGAVGGTLDVTGNSTLGGTLGVTGALTGTSTISASGFKIGAVSGWSGVVTNISDLSTNVLYYSGGVVTNAVRNP